GTIIKPNRTEHLSADALSTPQEPTNLYVSALYHSPFSTRWFVLTFGTDSSLSTNPGWDNVTGPAHAQRRELHKRSRRGREVVNSVPTRSRRKGRSSKGDLPFCGKRDLLL